MDAQTILGEPFARTFYEHKPLDTTKQRIRLLKLEKGNEGYIRCTINTFNIETAPPYQALSYVWGPPNPVRYILVGEKRMIIQSNLYRCLLNLRREKEVDYLWIDQICIDQSNTIERNHQVQLMSLIYSRCSSMIIWLSDILGLCALAGRDFSQRQDRASLATLLRNPYFTRLWIVQEVFSARSIAVLTDGNTWSQWPAIQAVVLNTSVDADDCFAETRSLTLRDLGSVMIDHDFGVDKGVKTANIDLRYPLEKEFTEDNADRHDGKSFKWFIEEFSSNSCEDPRDKIYGLMGLIPENQRLPIDYRKTIIEVYVDAVIAAGALVSLRYMAFPTH